MKNSRRTYSVVEDNTLQLVVAIKGCKKPVAVHLSGYEWTRNVANSQGSIKCLGTPRVACEHRARRASLPGGNVPASSVVCSDLRDLQIAVSCA